MKVTYGPCTGATQTICLTWDSNNPLCSKVSGTVFDRACAGEQSSPYRAADGVPYRVDFYKFFDLCDTGSDGRLDLAEFIAAFGNIVTEVQNRGYNPQDFIAALTPAAMTDLTTTFTTIFNAFTTTNEPDYINCDPSIRQFFGNIPRQYGAAQNWITDAHADDEWIPILDASGIPFSTNPDLVIDILVASLGDGTEAGWPESEERCTTVPIETNPPPAIFGIKGALSCTGDDMFDISGATAQAECLGPSDICFPPGFETFFGEYSGSGQTASECELAIFGNCPGTRRKAEAAQSTPVQPSSNQRDPEIQRSDPRRTFRRRRKDPTKEPTASPPTKEPTDSPPTKEPTDSPPTKEPTDSPPTKQPTGWSGRRRSFRRRRYFSRRRRYFQRRRYRQRRRRNSSKIPTNQPTQNPTTPTEQPTTFAPTQCEEMGAFVEIDVIIRRSATLGQSVDNNFDLGEGVALQLSERLQLDGGDIATLPSGYPLVATTSSLLSFTIRIPRFATDALYDPPMITFDSNAIGSSFMIVTSGSCESAGFSRIIGPDLCSGATLASDPWQSSWGSIQLYGPSGCDIGVQDGQDYGYCQGGSNSKPRGCSLRTFGNTQTPYSNTGSSNAVCSSLYKCVCLRTPTTAPTRAPTGAPTSPTATRRRRRDITRRRRRRVDTNAPTRRPTRRPTRAPTSRSRINSRLRCRRPLTQAQQDACIRAYLRQLYRRFPRVVWSCSIRRFNRREDGISYELDAEGTGTITTEEVEAEDVQTAFTQELTTELESEGVTDFSVEPYSSSVATTTVAEDAAAAATASQEGEGGVSTFIFVGAGVGAALLLGLLAAGIVIWRRRRLKDKDATEDAVDVGTEIKAPEPEQVGVPTLERSEVFDGSQQISESSPKHTSEPLEALEPFDLQSPTSNEPVKLQLNLSSMNSSPEPPLSPLSPDSWSDLASDPSTPTSAPTSPPTSPLTFLDYATGPRKSLYIGIEASGEELCLADIPELSKETVERAVRLDGKKKAFQTLALSWNPDKFLQRFGSAMCESEREDIITRVTQTYKLVQEVARVSATGSPRLRSSQFEPKSPKHRGDSI
eukprot:TRINITY_DN14822_c0_g1_i5.p1 TRINITY_DN14822_c0_g1~~TRINITY_DN14822_c0_g1_i5.p1  ORF type:complete len:1075 (-),score=122.57 TRINITY_DN14822_c0_g1_i5:202-3426(-)